MRNIVEMTLGNGIGFSFKEIDMDYLFKPLFGSILVEFKKDPSPEILNNPNFKVIGRTIEEKEIKEKNETISLEKLEDVFTSPLEEVFPINKGKEVIKELDFEREASFITINKPGTPKVLIPIFTGTTGEYTLASAFAKAGADVETFVFKTLSLGAMEESYRELAKRIDTCQILALANGFMLGDEPESGGKLIKLLFSNPYLKDAINNHLYIKDGLILGIGGGLTGLIKMGLIEDAHISYNKNGDFISSMVDVRVSSNMSPWFCQMNVGYQYTAPLATKEGRLILKKESSQISSQFVNENLTGSDFGAESLTSKDGRVFGCLTSIDRVGQDLYKNIETQGNHKIFESGVKYFK